MNSPTDARAALEAAYRSEARRVRATLIRLLGGFDAAEDALHEAFAAAAESGSADPVLTSADSAVTTVRRPRRFSSPPRAGFGAGAGRAGAPPAPRRALRGASSSSASSAGRAAAADLSGVVAVILFLDRKRRLQKGLALLFLAVVFAGLGVTRFGNNALLSEARERAREAELELAKLTTPRTLTPEGRRRVASALQKFAGQEFEGQVAPGSEDARPLWKELDQALRAANWVRVAPSGLAVGDPPAGIPLSPNSGVTVFVAASRANELAPTAHAVAAALMAEGLIAGVTASANPRMEQRPNVIVIEIGRKPS